MKRILIFLLCLPVLKVSAQELTDVSMFFKRGDKQQIDSVSSESGNLFRKLGHHGPAVENQWYALRMYFDKKTAIDVYSKASPGLELKAKGWYPSKKEQLAGWGADYYKAGNTVGLGGIKLWDGKQVVDLHPVERRFAKVERTSDSSYFEMISEGVPYNGDQVDISVRVIVYNHTRMAKVEATSLTTQKVQFVSGINYFDDLDVIKKDDYIATWGIHPEDVAAEKVEVGAAIIIPGYGISEIRMMEDQYILITEPTQHSTFHIVSSNEREEGIESSSHFVQMIETLIR